MNKHYNDVLDIFLTFCKVLKQFTQFEHEPKLMIDSDVHIWIVDEDSKFASQFSQYPSEYWGTILKWSQFYIKAKYDRWFELPEKQKNEKDNNYCLRILKLADTIIKDYHDANTPDPSPDGG